MLVALAILFLLIAVREFGPARGFSRVLLEGLLWLSGLIAAGLAFLAFSA